jgi:hypothetical protein
MRFKRLNLDAVSPEPTKVVLGRLASNPIAYIPPPPHTPGYPVNHPALTELLDESTSEEFTTFPLTQIEGGE